MNKERLFECATDFDLESMTFNQTGRATIYILARVLSHLPERTKEEAANSLEWELDNKMPDVTEKFPFADQVQVEGIIRRIARHLKER